MGRSSLRRALRVNSTIVRTISAPGQPPRCHVVCARSVPPRRRQTLCGAPHDDPAIIPRMSPQDDLALGHPHTHPSRAYLVPKPERTSEKPSHDLTTSSVRILNHQCSIFRFSCFRSTSHHHHVANSDRFTHTLPLHPGEGGEGNIRRG